MTMCINTKALKRRINGMMNLSLEQDGNELNLFYYEPFHAQLAPILVIPTDATAITDCSFTQQAFWPPQNVKNTILGLLDCYFSTPLVMRSPSKEEPAND